MSDAAQRLQDIRTKNETDFSSILNVVKKQKISSS